MRVRSPFAMLAIVALGLSTAACGGSSARTAPQGSASATATGGASAAFTKGHSPQNDRDNDGDHNNDDQNVLYYGRPANAVDQRLSVALVTSYFAAAAAEDGTKACSLLLSVVAESVAEDDGHTAALRGSTCAVVLSKLFKLHHHLLTEKHATLRVIGVRVEGSRALVVLEFSAIPEVRKITERRVGSNWKLVDLLDGMLE